MKVRSLIVALGCGLAVCGCASSEKLVGTAADGTPFYGRSFTPTERDGAVTLNCAVGDDLRLADCRIASERSEARAMVRSHWPKLLSQKPA